MASETLVCSYEIGDASKYDTKEGKALRLAFLNGPSLCIQSSGKITAEQVKSPDNSQDKEAQKNGNESRSYSVLGAFCRLKSMYEADSTDKSDNNDTQDKPNESKPDDNKKDEKPEQEKEEFVSGSVIEATVKLEGNGKTIWTLVTNANMKADIHKVIGTLQLGDPKCFRKADNIASDGLKGELGIVPIKVETYIEDSGKSIPFFGHCRFAIDSGTAYNRYSNDKQTGSSTITVALAPLDAFHGNKPDQDVVFHADYDVVKPDAILDDKLYQIKNAVKDLKDGTPSNSNSEQDLSEELSKYLNNKFQTPGDSSMYKAYMEIVKQINQWDSGGVISKSKESNIKEELKKIGSACKSKGMLIYF